MFNTDIKVSFRQKMVVLIGFQLCLILLANTYCACELAEAITYEMEMDEMADHYEGVERVRAKLEGEDLHKCCGHKDILDIGFDADHIDNQRIEPAKVWFMDPMDIIRSNMDRKYKEGKYLLFVDGNSKVYAFDLTLQGYDTEATQQSIRGFLDE